MSLCESISSIYLAAGGNLLTDSRNLPGRCCRLYAASGFRVAGSRLSHDSDDHIGLNTKIHAVVNTATVTIRGIELAEKIKER
jgi:hypothetical protein